MFFQQIKVEGLACFSYIIGCPQDGRAFVVDPKRDVDDYVSIADKNGLAITGIIDTHVHADHISGAHELRVRTGADIYIHEKAGVDYEHKPLHDGDHFELGSVRIDVIYTPGHTPNSVTLAITDKARGNSPEIILTGDLLFVGSVGRPDLAGGELLDEQISNEYASLHEKLGKLPDLVEVYPAHGAGSLCGAGLSAKPSSTLGFERKTGPHFQLSFDQFKAALTRTTPVRPKNFSYIIDQNTKGPILLKDLPPVEHYDVNALKQFMEAGKTLIDLRDASSFGGAHVPGSINIGLSPQVANWLGTVVDPEGDLVLLGSKKSDIDEALLQFRRSGFDHIVGYFIGIAEWVSRGEETGTLPQLSVHGLKKLITQDDAHTVIDIRTDQEWSAGHIKEAQHITIQQIIGSGLASGKEDHISLICGSGYRSNIAGSFLKAQGYSRINSVIGGMNAWTIHYDAEK
jgi:glyoxylase-like metal-dependent hydrolase (beta-lactamase superfamily II)/rhodanese-related sulfurtransferase